MFNPDLEGTFEIFSTSHLIAALIVFGIITLIIYNSATIRESKYFNVLRISLGVAVLVQELILNIYRIAMGEWMISTSLPLQLCGLGVITSGVVMLTKSKKLFYNTFFIMMIGATLAIITPGIEKELGFPHFRFFQFFVSHGLILINFSFILFVFDYQKDFKYRLVLNNFVTLVFLAAFMFLVNLITGGNYMYLMAKPPGDTAFDLFGEHPWYLVNIFIFGIPFFFHLFYLPFFIRDFRRKRRALA